MLKGIKQIVKQCFANVPATVTQNFYRRFNFFCRNITIPICSLKNSNSSHYVKTYAFSNSSCVNFIKKIMQQIYTMYLKQRNKWRGIGNDNHARATFFAFRRSYVSTSFSTSLQGISMYGIPSSAYSSISSHFEMPALLSINSPIKIEI